MENPRYSLCHSRMTYYDETRAADEKAPSKIRFCLRRFREGTPFHLGRVFDALLGRFSRSANRELRPQHAG